MQISTSRFAQHGYKSGGAGYSYALNNPLKFNDPDGEFIFMAIAIGAILNVASKAISGNIHNFWDALGAAAIGGLAGAAGYGAFAQFGGAVSFLSGAASGGAGGFVGGAGNAWLEGASFGKGLLSGLVGGVSGAALGGVISGVSASLNGNNFWNGTPTDKTVARAMASKVSSPKLSDGLELPSLSNSPRSQLKSFTLDSELEFGGDELSWYDNMSDGSRQLRESWDAVSGPHGNGRLPNGEYLASNLRDRTNLTMVRDGVGFSVDLDPQFRTTRTLLRIHPDGHSRGLWSLNNGTEGCIGLQTGAAALRSFTNRISNYFSRFDTLLFRICPELAVGWCRFAICTF